LEEKNISNKSSFLHAKLGLEVAVTYRLEPGHTIFLKDLPRLQTAGPHCNPKSMKKWWSLLPTPISNSLCLLLFLTGLSPRSKLCSAWTSGFRPIVSYSSFSMPGEKTPSLVSMEYFCF
jgi:hypothetical protein